VSATRPKSQLADLAIRAAEPADADRLTGIAHAAKRHWGYPEAWIALWRADLTVTAEFIRAHSVYCAIADTEIVAFYALSREQGAFELEHLWVDPPHLRRGIGARLLQHAARTVQSLGGSALNIVADPNAEDFYRRLGARRVGAVPSQPPGRELPLLVLELPRDLA